MAAQVQADIIVKDKTAEGLAAAKGAIAGAANEIDRALETATGHADGFGASITHLSEKLREFRSEEVQQQRAAKFFANSIAEIGVVSGETAGMLGKLASGFAVGGAMGLGVEAVKVGFELLMKSGEEAKKAIEEFAKETEKSLKGAAQWAKSAADELLRIKGFDPSLVDKAKELLAVQRQIDELRQKERTSSIGGLTEEEYGKLQVLKKQYRELSQTIREYQESKRGVGEAKAEQDEQKAAEQAAAERAKLEEQFRQKDIAADKWAEDEKIRGMQDAAKRAEAILKDQAKKREEDLKFEVAETKRAEDEKIQAMADAKRRGDAILREQETEQRRAATEIVRAAERVGSAFGDAFGGMIAGTKSVAQAFGQMAQEILRVILEVAVRSITASAMKAGGEAAAATAGIPIVGPALAVGAMNAMIGTVMALLGNLTSSSGGYEVPGSVSAALGVLHPRETVLPADLSDGFRQIIRGGGMRGGGGDTYQVSISALDARSLRDYLRGPGAPGLLGALGDLARNGRL